MPQEDRKWCALELGPKVLAGFGVCKSVVGAGGRSEMLTFGWVLGPGLVKGNQSHAVVGALKLGFLQELKTPGVELGSAPNTTGQVGT